MYKLPWMINERIKLAREAAKLTSAELARRVNVRPSSVSLWESGKNTPSVSHLASLAVILNVRFEWLSTGRGEMRYEDGVQEERAPYRADEFPPDQMELLKLYLLLTPGRRQALLEFIKKWM